MEGIRRHSKEEWENMMDAKIIYNEYNDMTEEELKQLEKEDE